MNHFFQGCPQLQSKAIVRVLKRREYRARMGKEFLPLTTPSGNVFLFNLTVTLL